MTRISKSLHVIVTKIQFDTFFFAYFTKLGKMLTIDQDILCSNQVYLADLHTESNSAQNKTR